MRQAASGHVSCTPTDLAQFLSALPVEERKKNCIALIQLLVSPDAGSIATASVSGALQLAA
jgi:hypothetical protein